MSRLFERVAMDEYEKKWNVQMLKRDMGHGGRCWDRCCILGVVVHCRAVCICWGVRIRARC